MSITTTCAIAQSGGTVAPRGRAMLRAEMTAHGDGTGCPCGRCSPPPLTDLEAQAALRHVSNADAVAFAQGETALVSYHGCAECGAWVPTFTEA